MQSCVKPKKNVDTVLVGEMRSEFVDMCVFWGLFPDLYLITGSTPTHTPSSSSTDKERDRSSLGRKRRSPAKFQPPDQPPACKDWIPDTQHHVCMVCQRERFTMVSEQRGFLGITQDNTRMKVLLSEKE